MTDNEIIQALEYKAKNFCETCKHKSCNICFINVVKQGLDLINRQKEEITKNEKIIKAANDLIGCQKAEIERLHKYNTDVAFKHYNDGVKEFAERLKETIEDYQYVIDNLVKEMVGEG